MTPNIERTIYWRKKFINTLPASVIEDLLFEFGIEPGRNIVQSRDILFEQLANFPKLRTALSIQLMVLAELFE